MSSNALVLSCAQAAACLCQSENIRRVICVSQCPEWQSHFLQDQLPLKQIHFQKNDFTLPSFQPHDGIGTLSENPSSCKHLPDPCAISAQRHSSSRRTFASRAS